jgi:nucleoside 2-deoxyribosyltransferase
MTANIDSVFVAGPFWALVGKEGGQVSGTARVHIETVLRHYDDMGVKVYNAHRRESWGLAFLEPEEYSKLDFDEISTCDVVVAFPGVPASPGTHIEIGWASAMDKPLVLLLEQDVEYAGLIEGLSSFRRCELVRFDKVVDTDALDAAVARVIETRDET